MGVRWLGTESVEMLMEQYEVEQLMAALPKYHSDGANITETIWNNGCFQDVDVAIKVFMRFFKGLSMYNVELLMKRERACFAKQQLLPIPVSPGCILLPIRIRKPVGSHDGAYGYVSLDGIDEVLSETRGVYRSVIVLKDVDRRILTMMDQRRLLQQAAIADSIRHRYFTM